MDRKPLLGVDILLEIALIAPYTTLSSLMKTCRLLYHECAKIMARRPVVVTNITDLKSFLAFLSAEDASRCCHLRHLVLDTVVPMEAPSRRVWQSLSRLLVDHPFQSLTSLYLTHAERLMHLDPDFAVGVASLTGLTTLHIGPVGTTTLDALRKLRCDLRVLVLKYADGLDQRTGAPPEHCHPVIIAQHFRHTLETLDVHGYEAELSRARFPKPYPRMHELILNSPDCPVLAPYVYAFPYLRNLSITTALANLLTPDNLPREIGLMTAFRRANKDAQARDGWTKLETVNGTVADLYLAGLCCPVGVLYLNVCRYDPASMVLRILLDASVSRLHLYVHNIEAFEDDGLPMVFRRLSGSSFDTLSLNVRLCAPEEWDFDLHAVVDHAALERLLQSLGSLTVRKFRFAMRCKYSQSPDSVQHTEKDAVSGMACGAQEIQDFDCKAIAQRVLDTVPAVEEVDIRFSCRRKDRVTVHRAP